MADLLEMAVSNPLADENIDALEHEDTDAVVVSDSFARLRRLLLARGGSDGGQLKTVFMAAARVGLWCSFVNMFVTPLISFARGTTGWNGKDPIYDEHGHMNSKAVLGQLYQIGFAGFQGITLLFVNELAQVIQPETGCLKLLGVGEKKVSSRGLKSVRKFVWPCLGVSCIGLIYGTMMLLLGTAVDMISRLLGGQTPQSEAEQACGHSVVGDHPCTERPVCQTDYGEVCPHGYPTYETRLAVYEFQDPTLFHMLTVRVPYWYGLGLACVLGIPSCAGWYYAMRVSALLARDDIIECAKGVSDEGLKNDEVWTATVATKTLALASHTMKHLSGGFGRGTGLAAVGCWLMALAKFSSFLELTTRDYVSSSWAEMGASPQVAAAWGYFRQAGPMLGGLIAPLFIAADVAAVSTMCDHLYQKINNLRLNWVSSEHMAAVHQKTFPLLYTMERLNNQQVRLSRLTQSH